jgi:hypothetical protein
MCRVNVLALELVLDRVEVVVGQVEIRGRAETEALLEGPTILLATRGRALRNDIAGIRSCRVLVRRPGLGFVGLVASGPDLRNRPLELTAEGFRDHGSEHGRRPEETAPGC